MKILAIETSAKSVSAAVVEGGVPLASAYQNMGLTHSRTLMPLVDAMLRESEQSLADMDLLAVAAGPGSFTGLRIGVSALKGLAWAADKPCCGVSTLEAMAQNLRHMDGLIVCSMDARRNQVYNAVFAAVLGHIFPIFAGFRGGKGVAVTCAWLMLYLPVTGVLCCLAGGVAVLLTGYLPVGAVLIAALAVPVGWLQYGTEAGAVLALNAVIMVTRHWAGLQRIHRGEELQFFRPKL